MMKQVSAMLRLDLQLIIRDKIIWYVLFFPAIIAVILILISGRLGDNAPTLAVGRDMPQTEVHLLNRVAELDIQKDRDSLLRRVNAFDNVAGVLWEEDTAHVIFEGNEDIDYQYKTALLVKEALNSQFADVQLINTGSSQDIIVETLMAALLLAPVLVGGTVSGFLIVGEKENRIMCSYQIAPIGFPGYIVARSVVAATVGVISMLTLCLLFKEADKIWILLLILICSLPLFGVVTILFASIPKDKISCIAMFKVLVVIFLVLPLASTFVPARLHSIFYPLPMYWQFQAVVYALNGTLNLQNCGITFASGMLLLILAVFCFRNRIQKI